MSNLLNGICPSTVIAACLSSVILRQIWYGPLFGKKWLEWSHLNQKQVEDYAHDRGLMKWLFTLVFYSLSAWVYSGILNAFSVTCLCEVASIGLLIWLGFVATSSLSHFLWEPTKGNVFVIDLFHDLFSIILQGVVIHYFRLHYSGKISGWLGIGDL